MRGPVGTLLWMLLYNLDTTDYTSNSMPTPRPPHFPLPAIHSTAPRPPAPFHRLSPPSSRRRPFPPSSARQLHPLPPFLPSLHRLEGHTPSCSSPPPLSPNTSRRSLRHHPRRRVRPAQGHNAYCVHPAIGHCEGQDIARVSLLNFLHEQWNSWWLRHLARGGEVRIVVAKSMPESVFAAGLLSQIRQRHLDLDALALHVATQEGTSTTKPAAMKLLTSKIFDFLISLQPTTTTDPASAASPSPPPTPTSSGKRPADPSQASLLDFGMKRPRLTTSDTPLPDVFSRPPPPRSHR